MKSVFEGESTYPYYLMLGFYLSRLVNTPRISPKEAINIDILSPDFAERFIKLHDKDIDRMEIMDNSVADGKPLSIRSLYTRAKEEYVIVLFGLNTAEHARDTLEMATELEAFYPSSYVKIDLNTIIEKHTNYIYEQVKELLKMRTSVSKEDWDAIENL